ncbi:uncharacterized protein [Ambystoma mexicanum]|uniref:uncharacterized protein isoform X2 n=1 Tax=Ambystoma mexicanum TaxID=8296 RepID=UPI0037E79E5F
MDKITASALLFVCGLLLLDVKYVTFASPNDTVAMHDGGLNNGQITTTNPQWQNNTTQDSGSSATNPLGQSNTTWDSGSLKTSGIINKPDNSEINNASDPFNTTLAISTAGPLTNNQTETVTPLSQDETKLPSNPTTTPVTTTHKQSTGTSKNEQAKRAKDLRNGIIILFVFIALIVVLFLFCWLQRRKRERNSFNLYHASNDNAGIPLSSEAVEKQAAENLKEDKVDIHHIQPPTETSATREPTKQDPGSETQDDSEEDKALCSGNGPMSAPAKRSSFCDVPLHPEPQDATARLLGPEA